MISPCCGTSLQQGTKFLAMLSMMLSVAGIGISSIVLFGFLFGGPKNREPVPDELGEDLTSMGVKLFFMLIGFIFNLLLAILLFIGAEQRNLRLCQLYFKVSLFLLILDVIWSAITSYAGVLFIEDYVINTSEMLYTMYELWVVYAFTAEMNKEKEGQMQQMHMHCQQRLSVV